MKLRFANPIIFPKDLHVSKCFYRDVMGLQIIEDSEPFILFEGNFGIHGSRELFWANVFDKPVNETPSWLSSNDLLLYFQTETINQVFSNMKDKVDIIHPIKRQAWGERVFRFYDPDRYIVEIGEIHYSIEEN